MVLSWLSALVCALPSAVCRATAPGTRYALTTGQLFIPDYFVPAGDQFDLVFHLHGSPTYVEDYFYPAGINTVLISIQLGSGSSAYSTFFSNNDVFQQLLDEAFARLAQHFPSYHPQLGFLCASAWSAGYGGIREILQVPAYVDLIDAVVLEDGLHTSYVNGDEVNPAQMVEFLAFAQAAVAGEKQFFFSHSQILTYTYASTTETADYLIEHVGAARVPRSDVNEIGMTYTSTAELGQFAIHGFTGYTAPDHVDHIEALYLWLRMIDFSQEPSYPSFPLADAFPATGRQLPWWRDRFTAAQIIPFAPVSPGGDGYVLRVMDPAGGVETSRIGNLTDTNYYVQCDIYCHYRPELAADGFERSGIFIRDNGNGVFEHTYAGGGYNYIMAWDSSDGRLWCMRAVNGAITDLLPAPVYLPSTAWRRVRIQGDGPQLAFFCDGQLILSVIDDTFSHGQCGIGYHEYFATNSHMEGARADNFRADLPEIVPTPTPLPTGSPTSPPTPTPTDSPPPTPTPRPSATSSPGPTHSPEPGPSPTPTHEFTPTDSPTPWPTPAINCDALGIELWMPSHQYYPGDACWLLAYICNPGSLIESAPVFVLLEVAGAYWFAPSWSQNPDHWTMNLAPDITGIPVLARFTWPAGVGAATGLRFHAAITDAAVTQVLGDYDTWEFAFGE